jgi:O-antigen ligase
MKSLNLNYGFAGPFVPKRLALWALVVVVLFSLGFACVFLSAASHRVEVQTLQMTARVGLLKPICFAAVGLLACLCLVRYAEIALALFFLVGLVKGDPRFASVPVDLTLLVGAIVVAGTVYRLFIKGQTLYLPDEYFFYLPLLAMMALSLAYTPDLAAGLDKTLRFVCLTSIGILAPFVLFDDDSKIRNFFVAVMIGGLVLAINSLSMLGGEERLVSPSGLNTELGAASSVSIIIIWAMLFPRWRLVTRLLFYPALGVLAVALIGSGGRFANVSTVVCLALGTLLCRKLFSDILIAGGLTLLALPLLWIPQASFEYLHSLVHPAEAMGTRNDLMWLGVRMFSNHPVLGVGVDGFRFLSPNPLTYNYPHNLFLELGSELGMFAAFAFVALAFCSFREIVKQLSDARLRANPLVPTVFLLLIYVFLDAMQSGDINDLRLMWFVLGLPFLLRRLQMTSRKVEIVGEVIPLSPVATAHSTAQAMSPGQGHPQFVKEQTVS